MSANIQINMDFNLKESFVHWIGQTLIPQLGYTSEKTVVLGKVYANQAYAVCTEKILIMNNGAIETSLVVKEGQNTMSTSNYSVNYNTNEITFSATHLAVSVTVNILMVNVMESFPVDENFDSLEYPIVAVNITDSEPDAPYAVGSRQVFWGFTYFIDIFAPNDNVRKSLKNGLQFLIKNEWLPLINFADGMIIGNNGALNPSFSMESQFIYYIYDKGSPRGRNFDDNFSVATMRYRASIDGIITIIY